MSYPRQTRLKLLGHAVAVAAQEDPAHAILLVPTGSGASVERLIRIQIEAFDWNCPKFITPRFMETDFMEAVLPLKARITELEEEIRRLEGQGLIKGRHYGLLGQFIHRTRYRNSVATRSVGSLAAWVSTSWALGALPAAYSGSK